MDTPFEGGHPFRGGRIAAGGVLDGGGAPRDAVEAASEGAPVRRSQESTPSSTRLTNPSAWRLHARGTQSRRSRGAAPAHPPGAQPRRAGTAPGRAPGAGRRSPSRARAPACGSAARSPAGSPCGAPGRRRPPAGRPRRPGRPRCTRPRCWCRRRGLPRPLGARAPPGWPGASRRRRGRGCPGPPDQRRRTAPKAARAGIAIFLARWARSLYRGGRPRRVRPLAAVAAVVRWGVNTPPSRRARRGRHRRATGRGEPARTEGVQARRRAARRPPVAAAPHRGDGGGIRRRLADGGRPGGRAREWADAQRLTAEEVRWRGARWGGRRPAYRSVDRLRLLAQLFRLRRRNVHLPLRVLAQHAPGGVPPPPGAAYASPSPPTPPRASPASTAGPPRRPPPAPSPSISRATAGSQRDPWASSRPERPRPPLRCSCPVLRLPRRCPPVGTVSNRGRSGHRGRGGATTARPPAGAVRAGSPAPGSRSRVRSRRAAPRFREARSPYPTPRRAAGHGAQE